MSQKSPTTIRNGEKQRLIAPLLNSVVGVIFHNRKILLVEHQQGVKIFQTHSCDNKADR